MLCRELYYVELRYTEQVFNEKDACLAGDLISLRNVEVYVQVRVVISRVDLHMGVYRFFVQLMSKLPSPTSPPQFRMNVVYWGGGHTLNFTIRPLRKVIRLPDFRHLHVHKIAKYHSFLPCILLEHAISES